MCPLGLRGRCPYRGTPTSRADTIPLGAPCSPASGEASEPGATVSTSQGQAPRSPSTGSRGWGACGRASTCVDACMLRVPRAGEGRTESRRAQHRGCAHRRSERARRPRAYGVRSGRGRPRCGAGRGLRVDAGRRSAAGPPAPTSVEGSPRIGALNLPAWARSRAGPRPAGAADAAPWAPARRASHGATVSTSQAPRCQQSQARARPEPLDWKSGLGGLRPSVDLRRRLHASCSACRRRTNGEPSCPTPGMLPIAVLREHGGPGRMVCVRDAGVLGVARDVGSASTQVDARPQALQPRPRSRVPRAPAP